MMAKKGGTRHIKSLAAPRFFNIHSKEEMYISRPNPGRHNYDDSVSLVVPLKQLNIVENYADAGKIIKEGKIKINGKVIKEKKYPVGLNDIITVNNKHYKVGVDQFNHISYNETNDNDSFIYKVVGKYKAPKGKIFIRLSDGESIDATDKAKHIYVGDSVKINSKKEIGEIFKFKEGSKCIIVHGVHAASTGKITEIKPGNMHIEKVVLIEDDKGNKFETKEKNIIVMS